MYAFARLRRALLGGPAVRFIFALVALCLISLGAVTAAVAAPHGRKVRDGNGNGNGNGNGKSKTPAIVTSSGPLKGVINGNIAEFLGIPYAAPPVGNLRWMPPQSFGRWKGLLDASSFGSECPQGGAGSEDCLFLNVYVPNFKKNASKHGGAMPVMFWIHGGGLTAGAASDYDPTPLVEQGVIVVTINYRLGYLGFFAQSALDSEGHDAGNYGLQDQQFAMHWVQNNIAAFGGDPSNVTIFGESAGGHSVYCQIASPTAAGLYAQAIAESGSYIIFDSFIDGIVTLPVAETTGNGLVPAGNTVATGLGCSTSACLRSLPASALLAVQPGTLYAFVDGTLLTQTPTQAFTSGEFNLTPVILGTNHDEWRAFVAEEYDFAGNPILTEAEYDTATLALWGTLLGPIVEIVYPYSAYPSGGVALGASGTDGIFACGARTADQLISQFTTTYAYEFNDENAPPIPPIPGLTFPLGAYHGSEIQYLMNIPYRSELNASQLELSAAMISYWTTFAATGNPNSAATPAWAPYETTLDIFQSFIPPTPAPESTFDTDHMCDSFWLLI